MIPINSTIRCATHLAILVSVLVASPPPQLGAQQSSGRVSQGAVPSGQRTSDQTQSDQTQSDQTQPDPLGANATLPHGTSSSGTELFGLMAEGTRFVYVLDRSGSMSDFDGRPLRALKSELRRSLSQLTPSQQFQIVFYNHRPRMLQMDASNPAMLWADDDQKSRALQFIDSIEAQGGTDHVAALRVGLAWRPDILFFLTDADRPQLAERDLEVLDSLNQGTRIYTIEFRAGPPPDGIGSLQRLSTQSGGQYQYVDVLKWPDRPLRE